MAELPGILNWAIAGWASLRSQGRFVQPSAAADHLKDLEQASSPHRTFIEECCDVGDGHQVSIHDLFHVWGEWCKTHGREAGASHSFGTKLRAACPTIKKNRPGSRGNRRSVYEGIALKPEFVPDPLSCHSRVTAGSHWWHGN